jgi:hypothetical protein
MLHSISRGAAGLGFAACAAAASAATNPYYFGLSESLQRDSYMARYGGSGADWLSSTGLRVGVDQTIGRQQLLADIAVNHDAFRHNKLLDNDNYSVSSRVNWATLNRLSGVVSLQSTRNLYKNTLTSEAFGRTLVRADDALLQAQVGLVTRWTFDASLAASRQVPSNQSVFFNTLNTRQSSFGSGIRWSPSALLTLRLGARRTLGELPLYGDDFARNDVDLSADLVASGSSRLFTRLSRTRLNHSLAGFSDVSGWTGLAGWDWQSTGKLRLGLTASRDNNLGATDRTGAFISQSSTNSLLSSALAATASWTASAKLRLDSSLSHTRRHVGNTSSLTVGGFSAGSSDRTGRDTLSNASLGLYYTPSRVGELGCNFAMEEHRIVANDPAAPAITAPAYNARVYGCSGKLLLR